MLSLQDLQELSFQKLILQKLIFQKLILQDYRKLFDEGESNNFADPFWLLSIDFTSISPMEVLEIAIAVDVPVPPGGTALLLFPLTSKYLSGSL
jgi:hypothetical protein